MKVCVHCGQKKNLSEFHADRSQSDGVRTTCKECSKEYSRLRNLSKTTGQGFVWNTKKIVPNGYKRCGSCDQVKTLDEFGARERTQDGKRYSCKECVNLQNQARIDSLEGIEREKHLAIARQKSSKARQTEKEFYGPYYTVVLNCRSMASKTNHSWQEVECWYAKTFMRQQARCAICGTIPETLCIDHDHETLELRGLLCKNCNTGIGMLQDSADICSSAVSYLQNFKGV